jgi:hypothetical protein
MFLFTPNRRTLSDNVLDLVTGAMADLRYPSRNAVIINATTSHQLLKDTSHVIILHFLLLVGLPAREFVIHFGGKVVNKFCPFLR